MQVMQVRQNENLIMIPTINSIELRAFVKQIGEV